MTYRNFLAVHGLVMVIATLFGGLFFSAAHQTISIVLGGSLMGLNTILLLWSWSQVFAKKSIALAVGVIVFKYALLGVFIYQALVSNWINPLGFLIGILTLLPSVLIVGLVFGTAEKKKVGSGYLELVEKKS